MNEIIDEPLTDSVEERYLSAYFGKRSAHYIDKFKDYKTRGKVSFNLGAFLLGLIWFFYRKLWLEGLVLAVIFIVLSIIEGFIYETYSVSENTQQLVFYISSGAVALFFGFVANYLYFKKTDKVVNRVKAEAIDEESRIYLLDKKGGISLIPFIIILLMIIAILLLK